MGGAFSAGGNIRKAHLGWKLSGDSLRRLTAFVKGATMLLVEAPRGLSPISLQWGSWFSPDLGERCHSERSAGSGKGVGADQPEAWRTPTSDSLSFCPPERQVMEDKLTGPIFIRRSNMGASKPVDVTIWYNYT